MGCCFCCRFNEEYSKPIEASYDAATNNNLADGNRSGQTVDAAGKSSSVQNVLPITAPLISMDELQEITDNFGQNALIGEGSYGRVYYGILGNGQAAAIKKLDFSNQQESDNEFLAQVSRVSRLKHENVVELIGYHVDGNVRVLAYEFATMGSLHDILHGRKGVQNSQPGPVLDWMQRVKIA
eukprot:c21640_g2_i1 orf=1-543(-)